MQERDPKQAAIFATLDKFNEAIIEWVMAERDEKTANQLLANAKERKAKAEEKWTKCFAVAQLFGFDLDKEWDKAEAAKKMAEPNPLLHVPHRPVVTPAIAANVVNAGTGKPKTIREHLIDAAQQAHPNPVRASVLRQELATKFGIKTHEKTVGMTLYRLLKDGLLRRAGRDWFFIPEAERQHTAPAQEEESPGSDPGLLLDAAE